MYVVIVNCYISFVLLNENNAEQNMYSTYEM